MSTRVYRDYQRDRVGWFFGLTGLQLGLLAAGALPVAWAVRAGWWASVVAALIGWAGLLVLVVVPVRGRTVLGWASTGLWFSARRLTGRTRWSSRLATGTVGQPSERIVGSGEPEGPDVPDLPAPCDQLVIHGLGTATASRARTPGAAVHDLRTGSWALAARLGHSGLDWLTVLERDQHAAGLSGLLDAACRTALVSEVQVLVRTGPDDGVDREHWLLRSRAGTGPRMARTVHDDLRRHLTPAATQTETFLILRVAGRRLARQAARRASSRRRDRLGAGLDLLETLAAEVAGQTEAQLGATVAWLTSPELAAACRAGFHPDVTAALADARASSDLRAEHPACARVPWAAAGPAHADTRPRSYRHDGWESASMSLLLPSRGATVGALAPVLRGGGVGERRCLIVGFPVMSATVADRLTASREWAADLGDGLRARAGVRPRARTRADQAAARGVDAKLVAGAALCRPYAIATTTVPAAAPTDPTVTPIGAPTGAGRTIGTLDTIGAASRRLEASIRQAGFAPQRLDLAHDSAFAVGCLPLGRSLTDRGDAG